MKMFFHHVKELQIKNTKQLCYPDISKLCRDSFPVISPGAINNRGRLPVPLLTNPSSAFAIMLF